MSAGEKKYLRMTVNERVQHFFLLSSFITLVITGFWLKFPEAWWVKWIVALIGKHAFDARSAIHRIAAIIMILVSLYHVFYISFTARGRKLVKDLWFKKQDMSDLFQSVLYLVGLSKDKPKYGRFGYTEKMEYWAVVWGSVVMGLTGGVLWLENTFLMYIKPEGMYIATTIHYYEAILASLAILVWHFYFVMFNPDVFPMNKAWLLGYLNREEMEKEHSAELEEIEGSMVLSEAEEIVKEKEPERLKTKPEEEKKIIEQEKELEIKTEETDKEDTQAPENENDVIEAKEVLDITKEDSGENSKPQINSSK